MKNKEKLQLVEYCVTEIQTGKTKHSLIQHLKDIIKLNSKTANTIYENSVQHIRDLYSTNKERQRDLISFKLDDLYEKSYAANKHGVCLNILRESAELQGLKVINVDLNANVTDESVTQLVQVLQLIQVTANEGIENVLLKSIEQFTSSPESDPSSDT
jgi:hypothetical protein